MQDIMKKLDKLEKAVSGREIIHIIVFRTLAETLPCPGCSEKIKSAAGSGRKSFPVVHCAEDCPNKEALKKQIPRAIRFRIKGTPAADMKRQQTTKK